MLPDKLSNSEGAKRTLRIDNKMLKDAESADPNKNKKQAAEELRTSCRDDWKAGEVKVNKSGVLCLFQC